MEIITKVISTQTIKPSSQTPKSLQKHQLSFLDQLAPPFFMSLVYFYSSNTKIPNSQKSYHLKKSLSETLSRFYPLAGRLVDNLYIDCNDRCAPFAEAEANCDLSRVITKPDPKNMHNFLPYQLINESQDFCMVVQATYFHCGGISVGLLISHKIADALSMVVFANTWSGGMAPPFPHRQIFLDSSTMQDRRKKRSPPESLHFQPRKLRLSNKCTPVSDCNGYVAQLMRGDDKHMHEMNEVMAQVDKAELVSFIFTGICGFPLYEADFGWGKPVWVGSAGFPFKNLVIFMDTKYGNGIEALIHLNKQDMEKFEVDLEISMIKSNL